MSPRSRNPSSLLPAVLVALLCGCRDDIAGPTGDPEGEIASIDLEPAEQTLAALGASVQLVAIVRDGTGRTVTSVPLQWTSSDPAIAEVDANGQVTSRGNGSTVIRAEASGVGASATITVSQVAVALRLDETSVAVTALGALRGIAAEVVDANGYPVPGSEIRWTTSNPEIVVVDAMGMIRAVSSGQATITARWGPQRGNVVVTVRQVPAMVTVEPAWIQVTRSNDPSLLWARVRDRNGYDIPGVSVEWSTTAPDIVSLEPAGPNRVLAHGLSAGEAMVTASFGSIHDEVVVVVDEALDPKPVG